jgi:hypothetical protein
LRIDDKRIVRIVQRCQELPGTPTRARPPSRERSPALLSKSPRKSTGSWRKCLRRLGN